MHDSRRPRPLQLHEDRYFDPNPPVRRLARELYKETRDLSIVGPHGHVPPALLAENESFPEPASLIIKPDHYVFRLLYSQGVAMKDLGIPTEDGTPVETDPRAIWQRFAEHYHLFEGTPTGAWLDYEFYYVFGVREKLTGENAQEIYDQIRDQLQQPSFRPRALFERFDIEVLTTTDPACSDLEHHKTLQEEGWGERVRPCFRPDAVFSIADDEWARHLHALEDAADRTIHDYATFIEVLEDRRAFFKEMGATSTDHGVYSPRTHRLSDRTAEGLFQNALEGNATLEDQRAFEAHMLMVMARMSVEDGLVMQIHPGSFRDHNQPIYERFGSDVGGTSPCGRSTRRTWRNCSTPTATSRGSGWSSSRSTSPPTAASWRPWPVTTRLCVWAPRGGFTTRLKA